MLTVYIGCWARGWVKYMKTRLLLLGAPGPAGGDHTLRVLPSSLMMVKGTESASTLGGGGECVWDVRTGFLGGVAFSYFL